MKMEATIENAAVELIQQLSEKRGVMERQLKSSRRRLIKALNTDLKYIGTENVVKADTSITEVEKIPICEFTRWCRLRSLSEGTIMSLIEQEIMDARGLSYIKSTAVEQIIATWGQREILKGIIKKEFEAKSSVGNREDSTATHYRMETQIGPRLELWDDKKINFLEWLEDIEWRLEWSDPLRENWKQTVTSLLTGEAREIARKVKKVSDSLTYDSFRQILVSQMMDENAKFRANVELSKMTYHKDTDVDEYVRKMVTLLKAKTPEAKEKVICEGIIDRLPAWAQDVVRTYGSNDTIKNLRTHMWCANREKQRWNNKVNRLKELIDSRKAFARINRQDRSIRRNFEPSRMNQEEKEKGLDDKRSNGNGEASEPLCFICRKPGHYANNCKEKRKFNDKKTFP